MEITKADSFKTELGDRVLWYDGDSTVTAKALMHAISSGLSTRGLFVDGETPDIIQYNRLVDKEEELHVKEGIRPLTYDWNIPDEYKSINVEMYVVEKLLADTEGLPDGEYSARAGRCLDELELYKQLELMDVLRTLIFVINTLIENNVVWGVGRGSSVSSYVLYLIGVHDVDSFKYGLNIEEFLRTE